ncbi:hypothetical protein [Mesorhizobium sp. dw_380]|uniref:hypothetical protein n=1 Tax=Mesorhizobium sp. dw_380 TaxID=2812001 RepID=UPI001BDF618E
MIDAAQKAIRRSRRRADQEIKPCQKAGTRIIHQLELDRPTRLLLNDDRPGPGSAAADQFTGFNLSVTDAVLIEEEANGPHLTWVRCSSCGYIPSSTILRTRIGPRSGAATSAAPEAIGRANVPRTPGGRTLVFKHKFC